MHKRSKFVSFHATTEQALGRKLKIYLLNMIHFGQKRIHVLVFSMHMHKYSMTFKHW